MRLRVSGLPEEPGGERTLRPEAAELLVARALKRFDHVLADVEVHFGGAGPRGALDLTCRTTAGLRSGEILRTSATADRPETSLRHALQRLRRLLARRAERRVSTRTRNLARSA